MKELERIIKVESTPYTTTIHIDRKGEEPLIVSLTPHSYSIHIGVSNLVSQDHPHKVRTKQISSNSIDIVFEKH